MVIIVSTVPSDTVDSCVSLPKMALLWLPDRTEQPINTYTQLYISKFKPFQFNSIFLPTPQLLFVLGGKEVGGLLVIILVLKEKTQRNRNEYNLRYLLAKARTTWGKVSNRFRQQANKRNKNRVGRLPTSERNRKIILPDEVRCRIRKRWSLQVRASSYISNNSTNRTQQFLRFITWRLCMAHNVSGVLTPIIRSSTTAVAASGFTVGAWW